MLKKFWNGAKPVIVGLLTSKKALATIAGIVVALGNKFGLGLDGATTIKVLGMIAAYVVGQGIADNGKEAVKVDIAAQAADANAEIS